MANRLPPVRSFANAHDKAAAHNIAAVPVGKLEIDSFAARLCNGDVRDLRIALIKVYWAADKYRRSTKSTKFQISEARKGCSLVYKAARHLRNVRPASRRGLEPVFGLAPDDPKGTDELGSLDETCWGAEYELMRIGEQVEHAIRIEVAKPSQRGERKKRLRSLVEALADWWQDKGKKLRITVDASRRDPWRGRKQTAIVRGRRSEFLDLAQALFCGVDIFKPSEVIAAATHVCRERLRKGNRRRESRLV